ncbi:hypothetical protein HMPREF3150_05414 [Pseudomonas aeruginosa]|nr:hypothetical protein HMPREF3150_05414 [Pseudomonas aeruginosa]
MQARAASARRPGRPPGVLRQNTAPSRFGTLKPFEKATTCCTNAPRRDFFAFESIS